jgi:hypothetical protein
MRLFRIHFSDTGAKGMAARGISYSFRTICLQFRCGGASFSHRGEGLISFAVFGTTPAVTGARLGASLAGKYR